VAKDLSYKPDYGSRLMNTGVGPDVDHFFYDFRLYNLTVLTRGHVRDRGANSSCTEEMSERFRVNRWDNHFQRYGSTSIVDSKETQYS
jgi:hypothetical protein